MHGIRFEVTLSQAVIELDALILLGRIKVKVMTALNIVGVN